MGKEGWKNGGRKWRGWRRRGGGMLGEEWGGLRKRGREGNGEGGGGGVEECWRGMGRVEEEG